jgi:predicted dehydrogenase
LPALLADPELDAVLIATPDALHAEQAIAAARAGKHVLCEKPMATRARDAHAMVAACAEAGVTLGVAYHLRWHLGHRALATRVHELGELRHARVCWSRRVADASNWRAGTEVGRWWALAAMGTHCVDLLGWLMRDQGEVVEAHSLRTNAVFGGPRDETAIVTLRFAGGASAEIVVSMVFDSTSRVELYGSQAAAICDNTLGPHGSGTIMVGAEPLDFTVVIPTLARSPASFAQSLKAARPGRWQEGRATSRSRGGRT